MDLNQLMALIKQEYKSFSKITETSNEALVKKIRKWQLKGELKDSTENNGKGKNIEILLKENPSLIKALAILQYPGEIQTIYGMEKLLLKLAFLENSKYESIESLQNSFMALCTAYNQEYDFYGKIFEYPALLNSIEALDFITNYDKCVFTIFDLAYSLLKASDLSTSHLQDTNKENDTTKKSIDLFRTSFKNLAQGMVELLLQEENVDLDYNVNNVLDIIYSNKPGKEKIFDSLADYVYSKYSSDENNSVTKEIILDAFNKTSIKINLLKDLKQLPRNHDNKPDNEQLIACIGASVFSGKNLPKGKHTIIEGLDENLSSLNSNIKFRFINFAKSGKGIQYGTDFFTKEYPYNKKTKFDGFFINLITNDLHKYHSKYYVKENVYNPEKDIEESIDLCNTKTIYDLVYNGYKSIIEQIKLHNEPCKIFLAPTVPNTWLFPDNAQTKFQIKSAINKLILENQDKNYNITLIEASPKLLYGPQTKEKAVNTIWEDGMHIQNHDDIAKIAAEQINDSYKGEYSKLDKNSSTNMYNSIKSTNIPTSGANKYKLSLK